MRRANTFRDAIWHQRCTGRFRYWLRWSAGVRSLRRGGHHRAVSRALPEEVTLITLSLQIAFSTPYCTTRSMREFTSGRCRVSQSLRAATLVGGTVVCRHICTSASHCRSPNIFLAHVRHSVSRYIVVTVDCETIQHDDYVHDSARNSLYPPHILLLPVKAARPCKTRQLSKTAMM